MTMREKFPAMQKYDLEGPLSEIGIRMGPRVGAVGLPPAGLPEEDV